MICQCIHFCLRFFPLLERLRPPPGPPDGVTFPTAPCPLPLSCCQKSAILVMCRAALAVALMAIWMNSNGNSCTSLASLSLSSGRQSSVKQKIWNISLDQQVGASICHQRASPVTVILFVTVSSGWDASDTCFTGGYLPHPFQGNYTCIVNCRTRSSFAMLPEIKSS